MQEKDLALRIAQALYDRKAQDILVLKVGHLTVLADYLVIANGNNALQTRALMEHVDEALSAQGIMPMRLEGQNEGRWIVMDYSSVIVHLFHPEDRSFYRLERLWADGSNRVALPFEAEQQAEPVQ